MNIKESLKKEYKYRIEMHAHTKPVSPCSEVTPAELAEIYSKCGYDAIVLTNHFIYGLLTALPKEEAIDRYLKDYSELSEACEKYGIKTMLGAEIRFCQNENDYILYGVDRELLEKTFDYLPEGIEKFAEDVNLEKTVFIQAHPFRNGMEPVNPDLLDGIEVFNMHPGHNARIGLASKHAKNNAMKITTIGSDFHHKNVGHEGVAALRTKILPNDSYELAEILKSGDYIFDIADNEIILP